MVGDHGASGSQASADPPEHVTEKGAQGKLQGRSYNADAFVDHDDRRADDGAREPAPGEANPTQDAKGRGFDQRGRSP